MSKIKIKQHVKSLKFSRVLREKFPLRVDTEEVLRGV